MPTSTGAQRPYQDNWLNYLQDYIAENPRLAAAIAFQIGIIAGAASKNAGRMMRQSGAANTLMDALPSSIAGLMPAFAGARAPAGRRRAAAKRTARRTTRKRKQV